jgi:hypothetical protein
MPNIPPSNPSEVMVIRKLSENVTTFSLPFARFGKLRIGGRGTIGEPPFPQPNFCIAIYSVNGMLIIKQSDYGPVLLPYFRLSLSPLKSEMSLKPSEAICGI